MAKIEKSIKSYDDLPIVMNISDFMNATGLSKVTAYEVVNGQGFNKIKVGKRILIPKEAFLQWIKENTS